MKPIGIEMRNNNIITKKYNCNNLILKSKSV